MMIRGIVVRGKGEGRRLGYPTANLQYDGPRVQAGVYVARVNIKYQISNSPALAIVGMWELQSGLPSLEIYILANARIDANPRALDLYDKTMSVEIGERLRGLMKFETEEELKEQIEKDIVGSGLVPDRGGG